MLAPILTPVIAQRFGWTRALYFASAVVLLGMMAWLLIGPTQQAVAKTEGVV
jgi:hypothetical protein